MLMFNWTDEQYNNYRLRVLAKADGKNVHKINSYLGRVLNSNLNARYSRDKKNICEEQKRLRMRDVAVEDIEKMLGGNNV